MLMGDGVERLAEKEDAEPAMERFQTMLARRVKREPLPAHHRPCVVSLP